MWNIIRCRPKTGIVCWFCQWWSPFANSYTEYVSIYASTYILSLLFSDLLKFFSSFRLCPRLFDKYRNLSYEPTGTHSTPTDYYQAWNWVCNRDESVQSFVVFREHPVVLNSYIKSNMRIIYTWYDKIWLKLVLRLAYIFNSSFVILYLRHSSHLGQICMIHPSNHATAMMCSTIKISLQIHVNTKRSIDYWLILGSVVSELSEWGIWEFNPFSFSKKRCLNWWFRMVMVNT